MLKIYECIHCGCTVDEEGYDATGSLVCGPFAYDEDMFDHLHDWDTGALS